MHGLILQGGGSRGAYQVGCLLALSEILPDRQSPFSVVSGVSVGAINATVLAMESRNFRKGTLRLKNYWMKLGHQDVYNIGRYGVFSAWKKLLSNEGHNSAFFENSPLANFLEPKIDWEAIHELSERKTNPTYLNIHAYNYSNAQNEIFTNYSQRHIKNCVDTTFNVDHIIASASLPYIFPGKRIGNHVYGDGGFKLEEPASALIRQGCRKILAISLDDGQGEKNSIIEHLFDAIFPDAVETDFGKINQINKSLPRFKILNRSKYNNVDTLLLRPSEERFPNKEKLIDTLPTSLAYLAKFLGIQDNPDSNILNYLVFSPEYTEYLIHQGYSDTIAQVDLIIDFFN